MLDISEQLKAIRKERNLTIQAVSIGAGIPIRTYQNYEYGKREISAEALYKLADFYHVSTDYLLGRNSSEPQRLTESEKDLEESIMEKYRQLPEEFRKEFLQGVIDAVKRQEGNAQETQQNPRIARTTTIGALMDEAEARAEEEISSKDAG